MAVVSRLDVAIETVRRASLLARRVRAERVDGQALAKQDRSPVTVADFAVQALVSLDLGEHLPGDPILGEEASAQLRDADNRELRDHVVAAVERFRPGAGTEAVLAAIDRCSAPAGASGSFWTLDPVDGTKGFLRGGQYAIALALIEDGRVVLAALGCPELLLDPERPEAGTGCLLAARRGGGSRCFDLDGNDLGPISVTPTTDPAHAVFCESVEAAHSAHDLHARIAARLGVTAPPVRMDSQCKYAALARGEGSIYLRLPRTESYQEKIWDHAAGGLVIEEAGGRVTDARGRDLDFSAGRTLSNNYGIVASNGRFHDLLIAAVTAELDAEPA
ncbi:MAG: 3'(2'),5'-bisphosphate nucleotidase [Acidobacteria bacterium]|nr:3'(2'),5'-bisphosphate nucleotidase [Acidobacteriota bacterium]